jgi:hypothetical protein
MAGLPYDDIQTNQEVMDAVDHGHRLELGQRLESDKHLAKLATMVEDSWDQRADARPSFKHLARKCEHLFEGLKVADSEDEDSDTAVVLKELQKDGYTVPNRAKIYAKRLGNDLYEDEIAKQRSESDSEHPYEHERR